MSRTAIEKEVARAKQMQKDFGVGRAAAYLRNRSWSLDGALRVLLGVDVRPSTQATRIAPAQFVVIGTSVDYLYSWA